MLQKCWLGKQNIFAKDNTNPEQERSQWAILQQQTKDRWKGRQVTRILKKCNVNRFVSKQKNESKETLDVFFLF